ncbi:MAG: D-alanyl-D-alanine carboxypeptidase family protein [Oscillospiraceae bacterium]
MIKKTISTIICILIVISACAPVFARDFGFNIDTVSNEVYLLNLDTDEVIFQKNADVQVHPASTTKIMTAALAMELCSDLKGTLVTVPLDVWAEFDGLDVSTSGLVAGEELSMYDLICCMMIQSGNEAASTVRDYYGGAAFIDMMNSKAQELGCVNTHFTNPSGVFIADHYSTAHDLAIITEWALGIPGFWEISQLARYTKAATNKNAEVTLATTVLMQDPNSGYYTPYIKGIKTGTTDEAGRCFVSAAQKNGMNYLLVILGAPFEPDGRIWGSGQSAFTETRLIYDWAFDNLDMMNICDLDTIYAEIELKHASKKDSLVLYPETELYTVYNKNSETPPAVVYEPSVPEFINAPVAAGQVIGSMRVIVDGETVDEIPLVSREAIELDRFVLLMDSISRLLTSTTAKIIYAILLLFVALYLYYALVIVPASQRNRKRRKKKGRGNSSNRRKP